MHSSGSALQEVCWVQNLKCAFYTIILFNIFNIFYERKWRNIKSVERACFNSGVFIPHSSKMATNQNNRIIWGEKIFRRPWFKISPKVENLVHLCLKVLLKFVPHIVIQNIMSNMNSLLGAAENCCGSSSTAAAWISTKKLYRFYTHAQTMCAIILCACFVHAVTFLSKSQYKIWHMTRCLLFSKGALTSTCCTQYWPGLHS